jgi:hypothetical protein
VQTAYSSIVITSVIEQGTSLWVACHASSDQIALIGRQ